MEKLQVDTPALNKQKSAIPEEWEYLSSKVTTSKYSECLIINQKITKHTKKQEGIAYSHDKKNLTETIPEEIQTLELLVKEVKSIILNMLKILKKTMDKELKEIRKQYINKMRVLIKRQKL